MKIKDLMSPTVECVFADASCNEAAIKMKQRDVGALAVVEDGRPVGLVTDRDIVLRGLAADRRPSHTPVSAVMTDRPLWCHENDEAQQAVGTMVAEGVRRLLVRDGNDQISGIVSLGDLARESATRQLAADALGALCVVDER